ncbi:DUF3631 domain-containing protein [Corynebacterium sp. H128]|uniref:DUF3631 domain-containing protein n=1 Tax=Corynebacterium sp. H128 TaxID=3133427 RepID=UPI00309A732E
MSVPNTKALGNVLEQATKLIRKYVILPGDHDAEVAALWAAHTWVTPAFYTTPRLVFSSPVPGSGKTRAIEVLELISFNPRTVISSSPAALFRSIGKAHKEGVTPPTILFDEIDAVFGNSNPSEGSEQLRSIMNAGYKRGATVARCEGSAEVMSVVDYQIFSALALAGIAGKLPDTIRTRAIIMNMKKRLPHERVSPFKSHKAAKEAQSIVAAFDSWAPSAISTLMDVEPDMPPGVVDRPAEVWEPLVAIADMAGGKWPEIVRTACLDHIHAPKDDRGSMSLDLLSDIRDVMGHGNDANYFRVDKVKSKELLGLLHQMEDSQWGSLRGGTSLDTRFMAKLLSGYDVRPIKFKDDINKAVSGYTLSAGQGQAGLADAWSRYLPAPSTPENAVTTVTQVTKQVRGLEAVPESGQVTDDLSNRTLFDNDSQQGGSRKSRVTNTKKEPKNMPSTSMVTAVTAVTADSGGHPSGAGEEYAGGAVSW